MEIDTSGLLEALESFAQDPNGSITSGVGVVLGGQVWSQPTSSLWKPDQTAQLKANKVRVPLEVLARPTHVVVSRRIAVCPIL